jgi:Transposase, Mutator family
MHGTIFNKTAMAALMAATTSLSPASTMAEPSAGETLRLLQEGRENVTDLVEGMLDGFGWANATLAVEKHPQLYCLPDNIALVVDQARQIVENDCLAGTNTRRSRRALAAGPVGKDVVSRAWQKGKGDWNAWNARSLAEEPIVRLILDGTVTRVRLDRKATSISLLVALGVRGDGQKVLLAIKSMGGESEAAWRTLLDDLVRRGLKIPELVIADGAPGLDN